MAEAVPAPEPPRAFQVVADEAPRLWSASGLVGAAAQVARAIVAPRNAVEATGARLDEHRGGVVVAVEIFAPFAQFADEQPGVRRG